MATFFIAFQLDDPRQRDLDLVYEMVHARGGYHYAEDHLSRWGRLPRNTVALPLPVSEPQLARVAFELELARLNLCAASIIVTAGPAAIELLTIPVESVPHYAFGQTAEPRVALKQPAAKRYGVPRIAAAV